MACLLALPVELRAMIIRHTIRARRRPCSTPHEEGEMRREAEDTSCLSWTRGQGISYEVDPARFRANCHGLVLANRLLCRETKREIERVKMEKGVVYELDVMVVGDGEMLPTWTCVPFVTTCVDRLEIAFRVFDYATKDVGLYASISDRTTMGWAVYSLLERFIALGPLAAGEPRSLLARSCMRANCPAVRIGTLRISSTNVVAGSTSTRRGGTAAGMMDFLGLLRARLRDMTRVTPLTNTYVLMLLNHIGCIELCNSGSEVTSTRWYLEDRIDEDVRSGAVASQTRGFRVFEGDKPKPGSFLHWKNMVLKTRAEKGLSTPIHLRQGQAANGWY